MLDIVGGDVLELVMAEEDDGVPLAHVRLMAMWFCAIEGTKTPVRRHIDKAALAKEIASGVCTQGDNNGETCVADVAVGCGGGVEVHLDGGPLEGDQLGEVLVDCGDNRREGVHERVPPDVTTSLAAGKANTRPQAFTPSWADIGQAADRRSASHFL